MIAVLSTIASLPRRPSDQQAAAEMRRAEAWVLADVARPLSLAALCRDVALPRMVLASACRTTFGRPLLVHLRELRLYQLQWALEDGLWFDLDTALRSAAYRNRGSFSTISRPCSAMSRNCGSWSATCSDGSSRGSAGR